jgi:hypothetical protein
MPLVEPFGDGLWQVRSTLPNRIGRVFFTFITMKLFYCMDLSRRYNKLARQTRVSKKEKEPFWEGLIK